jgi:hypothetical protein
MYIPCVINIIDIVIHSCRAVAVVAHRLDQRDEVVSVSVARLGEVLHSVLQAGGRVWWLRALQCVKTRHIGPLPPGYDVPVKTEPRHRLPMPFIARSGNLPTIVCRKRQSVCKQTMGEKMTSRQRC